MKIRQWLGYNEDASQYLLKPGELRVLNNLQSRRPGLLIARSGVAKILGQYDDAGVYGLYRRATPLGTAPDLLIFQKSIVDRNPTIEEIDANPLISPVKEVWTVRRFYENLSRIIDQLEIVPESTAIHNFCVAEDRHGRLFIAYGHGVSPRIYRPNDINNNALEVGLTAPTSTPKVTPSGRGFFIESVDIVNGGGSYYEPPIITVVGGEPERQAKLKAIIQGGNVVGVDIIDGGANFQSDPEIVASSEKIGSGFRAYGTLRGSAQQIQGFDQFKAGTITGNRASATELYGDNDSLDDNSILYRVDKSVLRTLATAIDPANSSIAVDNVAGIAVGDHLRFEPPLPSIAGESNYLVITSVSTSSDPNGNATTSGVLAVSGPAGAAAVFSTPTSGDVHYANITRQKGLAKAEATYDSKRRRFTANVPLTTTSGSGQGAFATLEFSPLPLGYSVNSDPAVSVSVSNANFQTYNRVERGRGNKVAGQGVRGYLYGEYWEGSEYDVRNSAENSRYGGLQASGSTFIKGFSGSISGRRADVYWPDYSKISVWLCVGVLSNNLSQWTRIDAEVDASGGIEFDLPATSSSKTIDSIRGEVVQTKYENYEEQPDATPPRVRIQLVDCPDEWVLPGSSESRPTQIKEGQQRRLEWYGDGGIMPRPKVDVLREQDGTISPQAITIVDGGSGWQQNAQFAIRLYQANAYAQSVRYNTVSGPDKIALGHGRSGNYVQFVLTAGTPDTNTPHGPPQTLVEPAVVGITGTGYTTGTAGTVTLVKRTQGTTIADDAVIANADTLSISWTASNMGASAPRDEGKIQDIVVVNPGRNYFTKPQVEIRGGGSGYGLAVRPRLEDGRIVACDILDPGLSYTDEPELGTSSRPAELSAVMRPAMRGVYRCAFRYVDRSETVIKTVIAVLGDGSNTLEIEDADGIEPEMILDAAALPHNARVTSVNGTSIEINQEIKDLNNAEYGATISRELVTDEEGNVSTVVTLALSSISGVTVGQHVVAEGIADGTTVTSIDGSDVVISTDPTEIADATSFKVRIQHQVATLVRDMSKPVSYSDLSPIIDVNAGPADGRDHSSKMEWSLPGATPPERADKVELWRTSGDQSLVFYRLEAYGIPSESGVVIVGEDTLTDEELFDADRPHYAALPVVLPNGNVNAYRFGRPRSDMSAAVAFQDRLWMGVSTSGDGANTLYYSEFDEFESFPDVNELPIQNNQKNTDVLTALVPFGSSLLAMQHTHTYALQYNTDPGLDASIQMMSHRGAMHQRCWDIHENVLYAADESGIYSMARNGEVTDLSLPIRDIFVGEIMDFSKREKFFLQVDPRTHILRFFCCLKTDLTDTPSQAFCYDIQARAWWTESFPNSMSAAVSGRPDATRVNSIITGAVDGNLYEITGSTDHANYSLTDCVVTQGGSGYREPPSIRVPGVLGAKVAGVVSEGRLVDIVIQSPGWNASWGIGLLAENGSPLATHDDRLIKGEEYAPIDIEIGPPDAGGIQATAQANFSVTPRIHRYCTTAAGESFVRLLPRRLADFEPPDVSRISNELDGLLLSEDGKELAVEAPPCEIGMEAIGENIPINSFVARIDGPDIYLEHPDGTPVSMLKGDPRTNDPLTDEDYLEFGGTETYVLFRKPFKTNIPFRMATGFMQLVNDGNTRGGDAQSDRSVQLVYTPTPGKKDIELTERFNGQQTMRANYMRREREGSGGFAHRQDSASTLLNLDRNASHLGFSTGVAKAKFASRAFTDMGAEDQHLQIELFSRPTMANSFRRLNFWYPRPEYIAPQEVVLHSLEINGVVTEDG